MFVFFFSSRRRHTRYWRDWSSDVCSSDLVEEVDKLTRRIQENVYLKTGVILTGIGVYSYNTSNSEAALIRNDVQKIVMSHDWALQMHGFYLNADNKTMQFDVVEIGRASCRERV